MSILLGAVQENAILWLAANTMSTASQSSQQYVARTDVNDEEEVGG